MDVSEADGLLDSADLVRAWLQGQCSCARTYYRSPAAAATSSSAGHRSQSATGAKTRGGGGRSSARGQQSSVGTPLRPSARRWRSGSHLNCLLRVYDACKAIPLARRTDVHLEKDRGVSDTEDDDAVLQVFDESAPTAAAADGELDTYKPRGNGELARERKQSVTAEGESAPGGGGSTKLGFGRRSQPGSAQLNRKPSLRHRRSVRSRSARPDSPPPCDKPVYMASAMQQQAPAGDQSKMVTWADDAIPHWMFAMSGPYGMHAPPSQVMLIESEVIYSESLDSLNWNCNGNAVAARRRPISVDSLDYIEIA